MSCDWKEREFDSSFSVRSALFEEEMQKRVQPVTQVMSRMKRAMSFKKFAFIGGRFAGGGLVVNEAGAINNLVLQEWKRNFWLFFEF